MYELAAIYSRRVPTLSRLSREHRWLAPVLVGGLTLHLYRYCREIREVVVVADR